VKVIIDHIKFITTIVILVAIPTLFWLSVGYNWSIICIVALGVATFVEFAVIFLVIHNEIVRKD
jgi:hypothetical protein